MIDTAANGAVDEPAEGAGLEFPRRAILFPGFAAFINHPAGLDRCRDFIFFGAKKQYLPFGVGRDRTPALFIAPNGFDGYSKQARHFFLSLFQFFAKTLKFVTFHFSPFFVRAYFFYHIVPEVCQEQR